MVFLGWRIGVVICARWTGVVMWHSRRPNWLIKAPVTALIPGHGRGSRAR